MNFNEKLNDYITELDCTAKELSAVCGLSPATISRYRSGERMPEIDSDAFTQLCEGIASLLREKNGDAALSKSEIERGFFTCSDIIATSKENLRQKLNILISVMNINISKLCQSTNYEASALFRIRNGSRKPSDPIKFTSDIAGFVVRETKSPAERKLLSELIGCTFDETNDSAVLFDRLRDWLIAGQKHPKYEISEFLVKLNDFDLNEYIRVIHFDELKVPTVPFQLPTSKTYFGLQEMMTAELDFLKTTVLSKSLEPVIMYSDMPMDKMAKDADFPKKWMFGMAMMLKKKLHLNMIHSIDRPFEEMMLGLESFIPMYMTGQISPYYLDGAQNDVFLPRFPEKQSRDITRTESIISPKTRTRLLIIKNAQESCSRTQIRLWKSTPRPTKRSSTHSCSATLRQTAKEEAFCPLRRFMFSTGKSLSCF